MKIFTVVTALFVSVLNQSAHAEKFEIFVTQSLTTSTQLSRFSALLQQNIEVDTTAKLLTVKLAPLCADTVCPEYLKSVSFKIKALQKKANSITGINAVGNLGSDEGDITISMQLNADNAMTISVSQDLGCKSMEATFLGSPSQRAPSFF